MKWICDTKNITIMMKNNKIFSSFMSFSSLLSSVSECTSNTERFELLIELAAELPPMPSNLKTPQNKIIGCASQAWIAAEKKDDGSIQLWADGEAQISKGFLALLVEGLSGLSAQEILNTPESELQQSGLITSLSPSRSNGALASFRKMKEVVQAIQ